MANACAGAVTSGARIVAEFSRTVANRKRRRRRACVSGSTRAAFAFGVSGAWPMPDKKKKRRGLPHSDLPNNLKCLNACIVGHGQLVKMVAEVITAASGDKDEIALEIANDVVSTWIENRNVYHAQSNEIALAAIMAAPPNDPLTS